MQPKRKLLNKLIFIIMDDMKVVWGIAPSIIQAKRQIKWFLPRHLKYTIEHQIIPVD